MDQVPVVDLSKDEQAVVSSIKFALETYGFFYVLHHGVPPDLVSSMLHQSRLLFDLPQHVKESLSPFDPLLGIGYQGGSAQLLDKHSQKEADAKEGICFSSNAALPGGEWDEADPLANTQQQWPDEDTLPGFRPAAEQYFRALYRLQHRLHLLVDNAAGLNGVLAAHCTRPFCVLKPLRYAGTLSDPSRGRFGAGAHCDWGSLTLLATDEQRGLQIYLEEVGEWLDVPPKPGCFVVNSGDLISRWTNNSARSALHRVLIQAPQPRYSLAFFVYPDLGAVVAPAPHCVGPDRPPLYEPITVQQYYNLKIADSMQK
mmetsp:Transcript_13633/g.29232  ORF Transcript_13633/g.29232 Transcript_13633/m.29232 type:complete len:314 (-) Transcript_13633:207-1148(-)|eukprot:CAMPEP_0202904526 /NCGR_PEP_ID=MMETSP1392-20130828/29789_1 /ASSEMBLY_ACC=CAM_ASM_000868 /TAXON_ID=225041 /ORGANISM="Chlamydomonas chlamydogama, Strain SAG 11-48b" /LENGTH=313 /DNA_ID=CAMNT_0049592179 /DNA_START=220 /DNA_END=1161 /DNA_ORIENTATION=-